MKTLLAIILLAACSLRAQWDVTETLTNSAATDSFLLLVTAAENHAHKIGSSNLLESLKTLPNWPASGSLPSGVIVMWSGTLATIPSGWALCDGNNGTPDLQDRFVWGVKAGEDPGGTGGATNHLHAGGTLAFTGTPFSSVINHVHVVSVNDPGHTHLTQRYPTATGSLTGFTIDTSMNGTPTDNTLPTKSGTTGISASSQNPAGGVASITPAGTLSGSTSLSNTVPPYVRLAFIMKL